MIRSCTLPYLKHKWPTVATINKKGEYEITKSKHCNVGDTVWVLEGEKFIKTKVI